MEVAYHLKRTISQDPKYVASFAETVGVARNGVPAEPAPTLEHAWASMGNLAHDYVQQFQVLISNTIRLTAYNVGAVCKAQHLYTCTTSGARCSTPRRLQN